MKIIYPEKLYWSGNVSEKIDKKTLSVRLENYVGKPIAIISGISCTKKEFDAIKLCDKLFFFLAPTHIVTSDLVPLDFIALNVKSKRHRYDAKFELLSARPCGNNLLSMKAKGGGYNNLLINFMGEFIVIKTKIKYKNFAVLSGEPDSVKYLKSPFNKNVTIQTFIFKQKEGSGWIPTN